VDDKKKARDVARSLLPPTDSYIVSTKVCVIGTGFLGTAIIGELARCGVMVSMYDRKLDSQKVAYKEISTNYDQWIGVKWMTKEQKKACLERITIHKDLETAVKDVDIVFEAIVEDVEIKKQVFCSISACAKESVILSSNTMTLDLDAITALVKHKENTIGIRFLSPVYFIPIVELSVGQHTSQATTTSVASFFSSIGIAHFFLRSWPFVRTIKADKR